MVSRFLSWAHGGPFVQGGVDSRTYVDSFSFLVGCFVVYFRGGGGRGGFVRLGGYFISYTIVFEGVGCFSRSVFQWTFSRDFSFPWSTLFDIYSIRLVRRKGRRLMDFRRTIPTRFSFYKGGFHLGRVFMRFRLSVTQFVKHRSDHRRCFSQFFVHSNRRLRGTQPFPFFRNS